MLLVAASLCGGSAWMWLARAIESWMKDLGLAGPNIDSIFSQINALGLESTKELSIRPRFLGQRHAPDERGSIEGIDLENFRIGALARGLARGIIEELMSMMPAQSLIGRNCIVCSGNALRRSTLLRHMAEEVLGVPTVMTASQEEAAAGAALVGRALARAET